MFTVLSKQSKRTDSPAPKQNSITLKYVNFFKKSSRHWDWNLQGRTLHKFSYLTLRHNQPFKNQRKGCGQYKTTMKNLKEFVNFNGGGDAKHLFAAYFRGNNTQKLQSGKSYVHKLPVIKNILQILKNCHDNAKDFDKRQWLSIVQNAGFSLHQLKDAGWKISTEHSSNLYPGAPVPEKRGRKAIANSVLQSIKKFVCSDTYSYLGSKQVYNDKKYIKKNVLNPNRKKVNVTVVECI